MFVKSEKFKCRSQEKEELLSQEETSKTNYLLYIILILGGITILGVLFYRKKNG